MTLWFLHGSLETSLVAGKTRLPQTTGPSKWQTTSSQLRRKLSSWTEQWVRTKPTLGGLNLPNRIAWNSLQHPNVDMFSNHYYYGWSDLDRLKNDARHVAEYNNKVFVNGEFGFEMSVIQELYKIGLENHYIAGSLVWALRAHSRDGIPKS